MNDNYEILICKYNLKKSKHFIKKPKFLPCHESICEDCILNELSESGTFFCKFCSIIHEIDEIIPNKSLQELIDNNLSNLSRIKVKEFFENEESLKRNLSKKERRLEKVIEFIEQEIEIRFESMKLEIDKLNTVLQRKVNKVERVSKTKFRKINQIQNRDEEIKTISEILSFSNSLKNFELISNDQVLPSFYQVGYLNALNILNINKIKTNEPFLFECNHLLKYPTNMCANDERILITDNQKNEVCVFDSDFKILKRINTINGLTFNGPRGISNNKNCVYICDTGNDRVVITDINFNTVKRIIGHKGNKNAEFNWPSDVSYYSDHIFVLDEINHRVQKFNSNGDFIKVVYSKKNAPVIERSNIFKKISVDNNVIAICNRYFVYIIDFDGNELQKVGNLGVQLKSIFLTDDKYLITHLLNGSIICYGRNNKSFFSVIFQRFSDHFKKQTSSIIKFNDRLLFSCMCDNSLIAL